MNKKREYTHEDILALGKEIEVQRIRARQVDQEEKSRRKRSVDTIKWRKVQSDKFFKKSC